MFSTTTATPAHKNTAQARLLLLLGGLLGGLADAGGAVVETDVGPHVFLSVWFFITAFIHFASSTGVAPGAFMQAEVSAPIAASKQSKQLSDTVAGAVGKTVVAVLVMRESAVISLAEHLSALGLAKQTLKSAVWISRHALQVYGR